MIILSFIFSLLLCLGYDNYLGQELGNMNIVIEGKNMLTKEDMNNLVNISDRLYNFFTIYNKEYRVEPKLMLKIYEAYDKIIKLIREKEMLNAFLYNLERISKFQKAVAGLPHPLFLISEIKSTIKLLESDSALDKRFRGKNLFNLTYDLFLLTELRLVHFDFKEILGRYKASNLYDLLFSNNFLNHLYSINKENNTHYTEAMVLEVLINSLQIEDISSLKLSALIKQTLQPEQSKYDNTFIQIIAIQNPNGAPLLGIRIGQGHSSIIVGTNLLYNPNAILEQNRYTQINISDGKFFKIEEKVFEINNNATRFIYHSQVNNDKPFAKIAPNSISTNVSLTINNKTKLAPIMGFGYFAFESFSKGTICKPFIGR